MTAPPSSDRALVVGAGPGLGVVLRALVELGLDLTVIVAAAEYVGLGAPARGPGPSPAVAELERALEALSDDDVALARAMRRPLTLNRLGRHPLGNLMLHSVATGFGDLGRASAWLGVQLGIPGVVLPATVQPLKFTVRREHPRPGQPPPAWRQALDRVHFVPARPEVPEPVISAIGHAEEILLAPGPLFRGVLAAAAVPDIAHALRAAPGRIVWICSLKPEAGEQAIDQLEVLLRHGVRVDAALCDPASELGRSSGRLAERGVKLISRPMQVNGSGVHDPQMLRSALTDLTVARNHQHG